MEDQNDLLSAILQIPVFDQQCDVQLNTQQEIEEQKKINKKYQKILQQLKDVDFSKYDETTQKQIMNQFEKLIKSLKTLTEDNFIKKKQQESLFKQKTTAQTENQKILKQRDQYENLHKLLTSQFEEQKKKAIETQQQEQEKRQQLANEFQQRIKDIQTSVEEKSKLRIQQEKENEILKEKLNEVDNQYKTRELIFETSMKKKEIEMQLQETKLNYEFQMIKDQAGQVDKINEEIEKSKKGNELLEERLNVYLEKSNEFQDIMGTSNSQFSVYKQFLDKLNEDNKNIDNTINDFKKKIEKTDLMVFDGLEKNLQLKEDLKKNQEQLLNLQNFQNALQAQLEQKLQKKQTQVQEGQTETHENSEKQQ